MPSMGTVRITIDGLDAYVRSPYSAKDLIRMMPAREWSPGMRVWIIPAADVPELETMCREEGYNVVIADDTDSKAPTGEVGRLRAEIDALKHDNVKLKNENSHLRAANAMGDMFGQPNNPWSRRGAGQSWADEMFAGLSLEQATKAYKLLARVYHPDAGGDTELMKLLNVAYDKRKAA